jgi:hypothetical protein
MLLFYAVWAWIMQLFNDVAEQHDNPNSSANHTRGSMKINLHNTVNCWGPLFLISSLSLYMELAIIRWISGEIRLFAYYKNLSLLAAFWDWQLVLPW